MKLPVYLDYAATTPVDKRVAEKMLQFLTTDGHFGNPASNHLYGKTAKNAVDLARQHVADLIGAEPSEIIWTSGATESDNLAIKGAAQLYQRKGKHIITTQTEHKAILDSCEKLEKQGFFVTYLKPQSNGLIDKNQLLDALRPDTILVSLMHVNNETGAIEDLQTISEITAARDVLLHVDAAQSAGKISMSVSTYPIDFISFSAHKLYGPKGIGALYVRRKPRARVEPQIHGGGQEQGMRSGTLATHQIVGMGEAFAIAKNEMQRDLQHVTQCRELFLQALSSSDTIVNGELDKCYAGILNLRFNKPADVIMAALPEIAMSRGSACDSRGVEPSYVLRAMGLTEAEASHSLRFSFGRFTTFEEIKFAAEKLRFLA